jgi:6-phosphofructokinase 2
MLMTVVTLTINPAIDISTSTETIAATRKLRCAEARRDPGGGGINVARVVRRLGSSVSAIYLAGAVTANSSKDS